ncbi:transposase [Pseudoalteromonas rubra]|uniref:transposase n=1 Tax=Pseudoalteromonas rubra TaxID=43658 RepID=UPI002016BDE1|nr:transposase [Pseudoalteromonas rubra]
MVDSTGLKVYGNGEWHARKHGANKRRTWRKLHLAIDANTHQIVGAELSTISVTDSEVLGDLLRPLRRKIS